MRIEGGLQDASILLELGYLIMHVKVKPGTEKEAHIHVPYQTITTTSWGLAQEVKNMV